MVFTDQETNHNSYMANLCTVQSYFRIEFRKIVGNETSHEYTRELFLTIIQILVSDRIQQIENPGFCWNIVESFLEKDAMDVECHTAKIVGKLLL